MSQEIVLALDAMGGDQAPGIVLRGANIARVRYPDLRFVLFGDESAIQPVLRRFKKLALVCTVRHTEETVKSDDKLAVVLRQRRKSSMSLAVDCVGKGEAHGVVSAGNTGALMAFSKIVLKTLRADGSKQMHWNSSDPTEPDESLTRRLSQLVE